MRAASFPPPEQVELTDQVETELDPEQSGAPLL